jgi:DNA-binding GntR family transcriptional regulator
MTKNILVTGGAGYIGSHTCKALALRGYQPIAFDNLRRGFRSAVKWGPLVVGDVGNKRELREAIETWVVRKVAGRVPAERLAEFEKVFALGVPEADPEHRRAIALADQEFHNYLVDLAENRRCSALYRNLQGQNQRVRFFSSLKAERLQLSQAEHLQICAVLRTGDGEAAARLMLTHILNARSAALQLA